MKSYISRKESIIISAIDIIDEMGINELSTREIANRQGITEAALYKHFKSKEEMIIAVLEYYCRYDTNLMDTIEKSRPKPKDGIMFFINSIIESYESHPAMTCLVSSYEVLTNENRIVSKVKDIFKKRSDFITSLVKMGQEDGSISLDCSCEDLSDTIIGIQRIITLKWRMSHYSFSLRSRIVSAIDSLLSKF